MLKQYCCTRHPHCRRDHAALILEHRGQLLRDSGAPEMVPVLAGLLCLIANTVRWACSAGGGGALSEADAEDLVADIADTFLHRVLPKYLSSVPYALLRCIKTMVNRQLARRVKRARRVVLSPAQPSQQGAQPDEPRSHSQTDPMLSDEQRPDDLYDIALVDRIAWEAKLPADLQDLSNACAVISGIYVKQGVRPFARAWGRDKDQVHRMLKEARLVLERRGAAARAVAQATLQVRVCAAHPIGIALSAEYSSWSHNKV